MEYAQIGQEGSRRAIAVRARGGSAPGIVWLGGYRSDMLGTKAEALANWCAAHGIACCRHDYSGHGESEGELRDGTISRWLEESLAVFKQYTKGPQILVGSSMGGWIALRLAQELAKSGDSARLHAMLLIAPAPDFTHELILPELGEAQRRELELRGYVEAPSQYSDEPDIYTRALIEDGEVNRVMTGPIRTYCPVHILQGMADPDVPWQHAMKLVEFLPDENVAVTLVKDGDHRLSRPRDIDLILRLTEALRDAPPA